VIDLLSIFSLHFGPLVFSFAIVNFEGFILVHLMVGCFVKIKKNKIKLRTCKDKTLYNLFENLSEA